MKILFKSLAIFTLVSFFNIQMAYGFTKQEAVDLVNSVQQWGNNHSKVLSGRNVLAIRKAKIELEKETIQPTFNVPAARKHLESMKKAAADIITEYDKKIESADLSIVDALSKMETELQEIQEKMNAIK